MGKKQLFSPARRSSVGPTSNALQLLLLPCPVSESLFLAILTFRPSSLFSDMVSYVEVYSNTASVFAGNLNISLANCDFQDFLHANGKWEYEGRQRGSKTHFEPTSFSPVSQNTSIQQQTNFHQLHPKRRSTWQLFRSEPCYSKTSTPQSSTHIKHKGCWAILLLHKICG